MCIYIYVYIYTAVCIDRHVHSVSWELICPAISAMGKDAEHFTPTRAFICFKAVWHPNYIDDRWGIYPIWALRTFEGDDFPPQVIWHPIFASIFDPVSNRCPWLEVGARTVQCAPQAMLVLKRGLVQILDEWISHGRCSHFANTTINSPNILAGPKLALYGG